MSPTGTKKLLLVHPYFGQGDVNEKVAATHSPPLGLGFLATYIRDHSDCTVEIIDPIPQGLSRNKVLEKVKEADFVGLPCYTDTRFYCFDFAEDAKKINPNTLLILGGPHVYFLDELILKKYPSVDLIVRGEGEETLLEIINGKPFKDIKGVTYRDDGRIVRNPERPFIEDIDSLYIDYSLLPDMIYYEGDQEAPIDYKKLKTAYLIESRGCPFQCTYCANEHWQRSWRAVSAKKIVEKMEVLIEKYGIQYFRFYDDLFTANKKRVFEFCNLIKEKKLDVTLRVLVRAGTDRAVLEALKEIGCESVGFGIESGSEKILKRIKKGVTREQILKTLKDCKELGIWSVGAFIISLPDETKEDFKMSVELMGLPDTYQVGIQIIFPGTPFYHELKDRGEISDDIWFDRSKEGRILYVKENFPSAIFTYEEAQWLKLYAKYYQHLHQPMKAIERYGLINGSLRILKGAVDIATNGLADKGYRFFKSKVLRDYKW